METSAYRAAMDAGNPNPSFREIYPTNVITHPLHIKSLRRLRLELLIQDIKTSIITRISNLCNYLTSYESPSPRP